jgi:sulfur carrier protein
MNIHVNGEERSFEFKSLTTLELLEELGLTDRRVAIEVNERIVPRANHAQHHLNEGDQVEIVHFVGGGA